MNIKVFQKGFNYSQDGPGNRLVYHLRGCNMRCPYCHNGSLALGQGEMNISAEELLAFLGSRVGRLDGVCISGGEPSLHGDLPELLREIETQLRDLPPITVYESEITEEDTAKYEDALPEETEIRRAPGGAYVCTGMWLEKLCGRINFSDRESLMYFQKSLNDNGIIEKLREAGCGEGDTVRIPFSFFIFIF